ncbi:MAG: tripartite tricarboxylate transporter substrate binding protein [Betaproteobacteria bacterium]|nr:MAG: tripartite tricarboxylate transporter substrate binding protein [Betaproteobacteria bacterium]
MKVFTAVVQGVSATLLAALAAGALAQQDYPSRPVRIIVPFPPGGSTDPMARLVAAKLSERWNNATIVVDNRPGGNTIIGTSIVARAAPDGYTMGYCGASFFGTATLIPDIPYNAVTDFVGVTAIAKSHVVLVVHPTMPVKTLKELVALAKSKPGEINFGTSGIGTSTHLYAELFQQLTGTKLLHVPYKGSGPVTNDLLAGRVNMSFQISITQIPNINAGRLRPLAVSGDKRLKALPDVPTFEEAGVPKFGLEGWTCLSAPKGTPLNIRTKVASTWAEVVKTPEMEALMEKQGMEAMAAPPDETTRMIKASVEEYGKVIKDANIVFKR